jgi:hypothetical protein
MFNTPEEIATAKEGLAKIDLMLKRARNVLKNHNKEKGRLRKLTQKSPDLLT